MAFRYPSIQGNRLPPVFPGCQNRRRFHGYGHFPITVSRCIAIFHRLFSAFFLMVVVSLYLLCYVVFFPDRVTRLRRYEQSGSPDIRIPPFLLEISTIVFDFPSNTSILLLCTIHDNRHRCLNRFSGAPGLPPLSDRAIRLCNAVAAAISKLGRAQPLLLDSRLSQL